MREDTKNRDAIINAIRVLRSRRVRPSGQKISWYLKRQNCIEEETTVEALDCLVRSCDILRVEYKGATSYRVAKSRSTKCNSKTPALDGHSVRRAILSAVADCGTSGGTRHRVAACLQSRDQAKLVGRLDVILQREVRIGILTKKTVLATDGRSTTVYAVANTNAHEDARSSSSESDIPEGADEGKAQAPFEHLQHQLKLLQKNGNGKTAAAVTDKDKTVEKQPHFAATLEDTSLTKQTRRGRPRKPAEVKETCPKKKGRPPSKRAKKEKKVYDPSEDAGCKKRLSGPSSAEVSPRESDKCNVCSTTEKDILCCNTCPNKVHPKCAGYGEELARKILRCPWTCMDCKSCSICQYNHSIGALIFCDKCDRAFHQTCHSPPLTDFPIGAWVCFICLPPVPGNVYQSIVPWLPTPVSSPELDDVNSSGSSEMGDSTVPNVASWSVDSIVEYFQKNGFEQFATIFKEQEIDGDALLILTRSDAVNGFGLKLGPALRMFRQIRILQTRLLHPPV